MNDQFLLTYLSEAARIVSKNGAWNPLRTMEQSTLNVFVKTIPHHLYSEVLSVLLWKLNIQIDCLLMERGSATAELHNCMSLISHANGYSSGTHVLVVYCHQQPQTVHGSKAIQLLLVLKRVPLSVVLKPVPLSVVLKCLLFRHTYAHRCNPIPYIVQQHVLSPHRRGGFWVSCRHPRQRGQWRGDIVPDVC